MDKFTLVQQLLVAAGTAGAVSFCPPNATDKWRVQGVAYAPNATSAADASNYATLSCVKGTSTTVCAARSTASTALTAKTPEVQTVSAVGTNKEINQTSPLTVSAAHSGTGVALNLSVIVQFERMRV